MRLDRQALQVKCCATPVGSGVMYRDDQMGAININERAPLFEATDYQSKRFSLQSALGRGYALLVFNRGFF